MCIKILFAICFFACIGMSAASLEPKVDSTTPGLLVTPSKLENPPSKLEVPPSKLEIPPLQKKILKDMSWKLRMSFIKNYTTAVTDKAICDKDPSACELEHQQSRRVGVQELKLPSRREDGNTETENDDNNMKMKLFRLMYETVRDSDLKVKRAELIKKSYANASRFEMGYLLGDITDKFNIMTDISLTLKRLYSEWKPIEHINAYEQIANLAIDVGHIVDMIKGVEKKMKDGTTTNQQSNVNAPAVQNPSGGGGGGGGGGGSGGGGGGGGGGGSGGGSTQPTTTTPSFFEINRLK